MIKLPAKIYNSLKRVALRADWIPFRQRPSYLERGFSETADLDDIYGCFRLILGRAPTETEWQGHSALAGRPLKDVVSTYIASKEFKERSLDYVDIADIKQVELQGFSMIVPSNDPQVGVHIYEHREYEGNITQFIRKYLKSGAVFLDVGANIGYFTALAASIVGQQGGVLALEPGASNLKFLMLNQLINNFDQVQIIAAAAADRKGLLLYDSSGSNGFIAPAKEDLARVFGSSVVAAVTIDEVCQSLDRLDMIKIDIEGAEYLAMKGGALTLGKFRPIIISEFSPPALKVISKVAAETYLEFLLADTDYRIYCFSGYKLVACGRDVDQVIKQFNSANASHIDIVLASPSQLPPDSF